MDVCVCVCGGWCVLALIDKCITNASFLGKSWDFVPLGYCPLGYCPPWVFVPIGFCPPGFLSSLDFVSLGYCPPGLLSPLDFVPLGFCPPWILSAWILSYGFLSSGILSLHRRGMTFDLWWYSFRASPVGTPRSYFRFR